MHTVLFIIFNTLFQTSYPQTSAAALEQRRLYDVSAAVEEVTENIKDTQNKLNCKGEQIEILKSELSTTSNKTAQLQAQVNDIVLIIYFCKIMNAFRFDILCEYCTRLVSDNFNYCP